MKEVNIYKYYKFDCFDYNIKTLPNQIRCNDLLDYVKSIKNNIDELKLPRYRDTINILLEQISKKIIDQKADDKIISAGLLEEVKEEIAKVNGLIEKGLRKIAAAYIPDENKLDITELNSFLSEKCYSSVTLPLDNNPIAFNFNEFIKCYIFNLYPAASIHIIKATEDYNRYFNVILKQKDDDNKLDSILSNTKKLIPKSKEELIDSLYEIGNHYKKEIALFNKMLIELKDTVGLGPIRKQNKENWYDKMIEEFEKLIDDLHKEDNYEGRVTLWNELLIKCKKNQSWHNIIKETNDLIPKNSIKKEIIDSLHDIRILYRNKIMHYNKKLVDDNDLIKLFKECEKVINQMDRILKTSKIH